MKGEIHGGHGRNTEGLENYHVEGLEATKTENNIREKRNLVRTPPEKQNQNDDNIGRLETILDLFVCPSLSSY